MERDTLYIEELRFSDAKIIDSNIDELYVELFGVHENVVELETKRGIRVNIENINKEMWTDGALLYSKGTLVAKLVIKPTTCILYEGGDISEIADFCYYIGNRHLALFVDQDKNIFWLPFDEKIFHQLMTKFSGHISKKDMTLLPQNQIRNVYNSQN